MNLPRLLMRVLLGQRLPITKGTLRVPGVTQPVSIQRDTYGVPYIEAQNDTDASYALGFCQGQDRSFQIETMLRVVRGTLAELVGPYAVPMDRLSRRIGFGHAAREQAAALDADVREIFDAFTRGVNAGVHIGCKRFAHEFALLRSEPSEYTLVDLLAVQKFVAFSLSTWSAKLSRLRILEADGPQALRILSNDYGAWLPLTQPPGARAGATADHLAADLTLMLQTIGVEGASNNWAVSSRRSATGRPLLANDPHLAPVLPNYWYLAHVRTPEWVMAGASFAGAPGFPAGHNDVAAWGVTAGLVDNIDLYIEELSAEGRSVRQDDAFVACEVRREVIHVKGAASIEEEVLVTPRGPIIGPALDGEHAAISMQATFMAARPVRGFLDVHRARGFEEFRRAFAQWPWSALNVVYADVNDTIGWQLVGDVPRRKRGSGLIPLSAALPDVGWYAEPVAFDEMPHLVNPDTHFVATANNQPIGDGTGPYLGVDWSDGYRQARIVEALREREDWTLADMQALQMDRLSIPWREMRASVLAALRTRPETRETLKLFEAWDGVMSPASAEATLFRFFLTAMTRRLATVIAPNSVDWAMGAGFNPHVSRSSIGSKRASQIVNLLREQPDGMLPQAWDQEIVDAMLNALHTLRVKHGAQVAGWAWGHVRPLMLLHAFGARRVLGRIFNLGPIAYGGDGQTIAQAGVVLDQPDANATTIANMRMLIDVGDWEASRFVLAGGQSGNPLSPHYADQLSLWQRGQGIAIAWSRAAIERATKSTLRLMPEQRH